MKAKLMETPERSVYLQQMLLYVLLVVRHRWVFSWRHDLAPSSGEQNFTDQRENSKLCNGVAYRALRRPSHMWSCYSKSAQTRESSIETLLWASSRLLCISKAHYFCPWIINCLYVSKHHFLLLSRRPCFLCKLLKGIYIPVRRLQCAGL